MTTRVRPGRVEDLEAVLAMLNDPTSIHRREQCRHAEQPESAAQLYDRLNEDDNLMLERDGVPIGYASWQRYGEHAHLNVMVVASGHQRQGYGKQLFGAFLDRLHEQGVESVSLRAYRDSSWAIAFYDGLGLARYDASHEQYLGPGFLHLKRLSMAQGQWPAPDKALFVGYL
ncbi:MAG TPA: GNAT family N-acetyltransferase [Oscillatoriaceae cyanobacterium]